MTKYDLKKIISQIRKYNLGQLFRTPNDFDEWFNSLNNVQINNFNSLNVDSNEIQFPLSCLINKNLLNCDDYCKRINAMLKLKNLSEFDFLSKYLCSPNFLKSKNYYEDIEMISKMPNSRYPLWVICEDSFINSPYHREDLKMILEAKDIKKENGNDRFVAEVLADVACSEESINSGYHQKDMELIAKSGSECLQWRHCFPRRGINDLAIDSISLKDKYHLENMKILADNPSYGQFLFYLMTDSETIKGRHYRDEVNAIASSKSLINALAIYYFITNPQKEIINEYYDFTCQLGLKNSVISRISRKNSIKLNNNPNYLKYLKILSETDEKYVLFLESLLSNKFFINSKYLESDLSLLDSVKDDDIYMDLYDVMSNELSLNSTHHISDLDIISKTEKSDIRSLLVSKATDKCSLNSPNHDFDMEYISKLNMDSISTELFNKMRYYLFSPDGINNPEHVEILENLLKGVIVSEEDVISKYLDYLENNLDNINFSNQKPYVFTKIKSIFNNKMGK